MKNILIWVCMACALCIFQTEKSSASWQFRFFKEAVLPKEVEVGPGPGADKPQKTKRTFYSARMMKLSGVKRQIVRRGTRHK